MGGIAFLELTPRWRQSLQSIQELAVAPSTHRFVVLAVGVIILLLSLRWAFRQIALLRGVEFNDFVKAFPGRAPQDPERIKKRNEAIAAYRNHRWLGLFRSLTALILFGFVIPTVMFYAAANYYSWFDASGSPFLDAATDQPVQQVTASGVWLFIVSQIAKGSLMDVFEVFHLDVGAITNNPHDVAFSAGVLVFRTITGIFATVVGVFVWKALWINFTLPEPGTAPQPGIKPPAQGAGA